MDFGSDGPGGPAPRAAQAAALRVAQEAAARVPAYGRFLRRAGYDPRGLRGYADFLALPLMDKASYLLRYSLDERMLGGELSRAQTVTLSSGTAGPSTLWPRFPEQIPPTIATVTSVLQEYFRIRERETLMVLAQGIGAWGFGTMLARVGHRLFGDEGVRGTVVMPGLEQAEALRFVEELGPQYDQILLVSYPALVPSLLEAGERRGIDWKALNVGVFTSGEGCSEAQRERILRYTGKDPDKLEGFVAVFGTTEVAGAVGFESRLCLLLRRLCARDPALTQALFGRPVMPSLVQYNPATHFLEVVDGEIILTIRGAEPLIRYNTRDRGGLLPFATAESVSRAQGYDLRAELRARGFGPAHYRALPFLYAFGRSDAVIVHGGNVYRDEVWHALEQPALIGTNTGNFEFSGTTDAEGRVALRVEVELRGGVEPTETLRTQYHAALVSELQRVNSIFRAVYAASSGSITLEVVLVPIGTLEFRSAKRPRASLAEQ
ncbi:MAG TPA: hypothetical protein VII06_20385 [Chloroflexota bacterium]